MTNNKNVRPQRRTSIVDDLAFFLEEILKILIKLIEIIITWLLKKGWELYQQKVLKRPILRILTRKMLVSRKGSLDPKSLGYAPSKRANILLEDLHMEKHTAVIGSTGSGKTVLLSLLQEHALSSGRAIIFFDPKTCPENIQRFKAICQLYKRKFHIVAEKSQDSVFFNPLLEGSLSEITERIMNALDWSEPFYKNESQMALFKAIRQIKEVQKEDITIKKLISLLEKVPERKTISGLISQLFNIDSSNFSKLIEGNMSNSLTYQKIREEGACVYIGISAIGLGSSGNALNKLYFGGLLQHCKESYYSADTSKLKPFSIFFDELSSIITEGFIDLQNKCRGVKMEITYATQCPSDIDRLNDNLTTQIFENTNNLFIFNQMVPKHTEFFAKTCGTIQTIKKTYATEDDQRGGRGTERETEEFLAHANIFRNLRVGQCVFLERSPKTLELLNVRFQKEIKLPSPTQDQTPTSIFGQEEK